MKTRTFTAALGLSVLIALTHQTSIAQTTNPSQPIKPLSEQSSKHEIAKAMGGNWVSCVNEGELFTGQPTAPSLSTHINLSVNPSQNTLAVLMSVSQYPKSTDCTGEVGESEQMPTPETSTFNTLTWTKGTEPLLQFEQGYMQIVIDDSPDEVMLLSLDGKTMAIAMLESGKKTPIILTTFKKQ